MEDPDKEQQHVRDYLLGYLDEGERRAVEEQLITDPHYMEEVLIAESELMEEYLDGTLSEGDRERVIKYILPTERQVEKLTIAEALDRSVRVDAAANSPPAVKKTAPTLAESGRASAPPRTKRWGVGLAAAATILAVFFGAWAVKSWLNRDKRQRSLEQEVAELNAQEYLDSEAISRGFIVGPLRAGLFRDEEEIKKFVIPETETIVQLRLQIGAGDYQTFQAVLQTNESREVLPLSNLKDKIVDGERLVIIYLPAKILPRGDYQLKLSGLAQNNQLTPLGQYHFRIVGR